MEHGYHRHYNSEAPSSGERNLWWAVFVNVLLTIAQVVGGIVSGSLSLIADAIHNFSDAASLLIAAVAMRIGRRPPDHSKTFGYKRAETIAALINLTMLAMIGLYLSYEAILRFVYPEPITGWIVVAVAGIALFIDLITVALTYSGSKHSLNIRAAFLHNLMDALASVGVIIAGVLIMLYDWIWVDAVITLLIAGYVLFHGVKETPKAIHLLMDGMPEGLSMKEVIRAMEEIDGVSNVHDAHVREMSERFRAMEAHVVLTDINRIDAIKYELKMMLKQRFSIEHSTLEFESPDCKCPL